MMRRHAWLLSLVLGMVTRPSPARAQFLGTPQLSAGVVLAYPEVVGAYVSVWPDAWITLDARATLADAALGVGLHLPVGGDLRWRHDVLAALQVGYVHGLLSPLRAAAPGAQLGVLGGYGLLGDFDLRLLAGCAWAPRPWGGWDPGLVGQASLGYTWL